MREPLQLPRKLMLLIAALQGLLLLFLKTANDGGAWPSQIPVLSYPLWAIAVSAPVLLLLSVDRGNAERVARLVGLFSVLVMMVAAYTGWQAEPYGAFPIGSLTMIFVISMTLACFKALMHIQQRGAQLPLSYDVLFTFSWRNALTFPLALLFTGVVWLLLNLWASLFEVIGIDFFRVLFDMDWFLFLTLALANGIGIIILRDLVRVIDMLTGLLQGLIKLLLPLAVLVSATFLASLPFVGLDALWDTGRGTALLLALLAVLLFFTNAVYQDGRGERPYPLLVHRFLYLGLVTTPALSALSFYGLCIRLAEYGWTVARCWAFVVWLILTLFAAGYTVGILRKRDDWTIDLARVNTAMGLVVLVLLLLANSPVLDFRRISAHSQMSRIGSGTEGIRRFDAWYAHSELARAGYMALEELKARVGDSDAGLAALLDNPLPVSPGSRRYTDDEFWSSVIYRPEHFEVPDDLRKVIFTAFSQLESEQQAVLVRADLDGDGQYEYAFVRLANGYAQDARIYYASAGKWAYVAAQMEPRGGYRAGTDLIEMLATGAVSSRPSRFDDLYIGSAVLMPGSDR